MRWKNTSTPTFSGSAGSAGKPSVVETMQLLDDAGNEVASPGNDLLTETAIRIVIFP